MAQHYRRRSTPRAETLTTRPQGPTGTHRKSWADQQLPAAHSRKIRLPTIQAHIPQPHQWIEAESFDFWREFLAGLRARGLAGVHLVISDAHAGLKAAVAQQFTGASWQRCRVHFMRNVGSAVSAKHVPPVMAAIKTVFAHTDPDAVAAQWDQVADTLAASFPKVASMMRQAKDDVLAFRAFPKAH